MSAVFLKRITVAALCALAFAAALVAAAPFSSVPSPCDGATRAWAETLVTGTPTNKRQFEIEQLTDEYEAAKEQAAVERKKAEDNEARIQSLEQEQIPAQQQRAEEAMVQLYKIQHGKAVIAETLFDSESLRDFLRQIDYLEHVGEKGLDEIDKMKALVDELEEARSAFEAACDAADEQENAAYEALLTVQQQRAQKKEEGVEFAISVAGYQGEDEKPASADDEESDADEDDAEDVDGEAGEGENADDDGEPADGNEDSDDEDADADADEEDEEEPAEPEDADARIVVSDDTESLDDGVDWYADEDEFIEEWTGRIDDYLEGSPLEGQGEHFARASWRYCVDPRWSPAISYIESSKGTACIRPYNAWGWGAADSDPYNLAFEWDSWEEAIDAHVAGLAHGYGYTISTSAARTYCPPGWRNWYNKTLEQMASI